MHDALKRLVLIDQNYERMKIVAIRAMKTMIAEIEEYFSDINCDCIHYIKSRVKSKSSVIEKANRKNYSYTFSELKDLAGIRIVCHNESDIGKVICYLKSRYGDMVLEEEKKDTTEGYRDYKLVIKIQSLYLGKNQEIKVEIQVRTIAQDLFGTLSRRDFYKQPDELPLALCEKMTKLSHILKEADRVAEELKQERISGNLKTKAKDELTVDAIIQLCKKFGGELNVEEGLRCQAELLNNSIVKISKLEEILENRDLMGEIDKIYERLLNRKADFVGKIVYGGFIHRFAELPEFKLTVLLFVEGLIKESDEYMKKQKE